MIIIDNRSRFNIKPNNLSGNIEHDSLDYHSWLALSHTFVFGFVFGGALAHSNVLCRFLFLLFDFLFLFFLSSHWVTSPEVSEFIVFHWCFFARSPGTEAASQSRLVCHWWLPLQCLLHLHNPVVWVGTLFWPVLSRFIGESDLAGDGSGQSLGIRIKHWDVIRVVMKPWQRNGFSRVLGHAIGVWCHNKISTSCKIEKIKNIKLTLNQKYVLWQQTSFNQELEFLHYDNDDILTIYLYKECKAFVRTGWSLVVESIVVFNQFFLLLTLLHTQIENLMVSLIFSGFCQIN